MTTAPNALPPVRGACACDGPTRPRSDAVDRGLRQRTTGHRPTANAVCNAVADALRDPAAADADRSAHGTGSRSHTEPRHRPAAGSRAAPTIDRRGRAAATRQGLPAAFRGTHRVVVGPIGVAGCCGRPAMVAGRSVGRSGQRFRCGRQDSRSPRSRCRCESRACVAGVRVEPASGGLTRVRVGWSSAEPSDPAATLAALGFEGVYSVSATGELRIEGAAGGVVTSGEEVLIEPAGEWPVVVGGWRRYHRAGRRVAGGGWGLAPLPRSGPGTRGRKRDPGHQRAQYGKLPQGRGAGRDGSVAVSGTRRTQGAGSGRAHICRGPPRRS